MPGQTCNDDLLLVLNSEQDLYLKVTHPRSGVWVGPAILSESAGSLPESITLVSDRRGKCRAFVWKAFRAKVKFSIDARAALAGLQ